MTPFSPFYAYIFAVFIMVALSGFIAKNTRILLSLTLCFDIAAIYSSKLFFNVTNDFGDDFVVYYQNYLDIYDGLEGAFFVWNQYEVGLPIFYKILSLLLPRQSPSGVLFWSALCFSAGFYAWLEIYGTRFVQSRQKSAFIAFSLFFGVVISYIGLTRQAFATLFLLFGFFVARRDLKIALFVAAIAFHLSSIFIIPFFYALYFFPRLCLAAGAVFVVVFVLDSALANTFIQSNTAFLGAFSAKVFAYFHSYINKDGYDPTLVLLYLPPLRLILIFSALICAFLVNPHDRVLAPFKPLILVCFIVDATSIIPSRSVFLVSQLLFNAVIFVIFRRFWRLVLPFFFAYFLLLCFRELSRQDLPYEAALQLFYFFDEWHFLPFYYFY